MEEKEIIAQLKLLREIRPDADWVANTRKKVVPQRKQSIWEVFGFGQLKIWQPKLQPAIVMSGFLFFIISIALIGLANINKSYAPVISFNPNVNFNDPTRYLTLAEQRIQEIKEIAQNNGDDKILTALKDTQEAIEKAAKALPSKPDSPEKTKEIVKKVAEINKKAQEIKKELGVEIDPTTLTSKTEEMIKNGIEDTTQKLVEVEIRILENSSLNDQQQALFEEAKTLYNEGKYQEALEKILTLTNFPENK